MSWLGWLGLGLALFNLALWLLLALLLRRAWQRLAPLLMPYLGMFSTDSLTRQTQEKLGL